MLNNHCIKIYICQCKTLGLCECIRELDSSYTRIYEQCKPEFLYITWWNKTTFYKNTA